MPRIRPACSPLPARVQALADLARTATREADKGIASTVFNQAALLASDVGLPGLAREWCRRHATAYLHACPLGRMDAIRGLEPLVNLARLRIRAGHGDDAYDVLLALYQAVADRKPVVIDGIAAPGDLTLTDADGHETRRWLWRVIIADGTRALTTAGRWQDAVAHLERHHGIGHRMLDGRQVAIVARAIAGDHDGAQQLLATTTPGEPWEGAVTACLAALSLPPGRQLADPDTGALISRCRRVGFQASPVTFYTRLVLSTIDAIRPHGRAGAGARALTSELADQIVRVTDGYAAREILSHGDCASWVSDQQSRRLARIVAACGLGCGTMPSHLRADLSAALDIGEAVIREGSPQRGLTRC